MKILVTKFRNIGDVLLSTPVFASLKKIYPDSELHVAVNDYCVQVIADNPHVDKVISFNRDQERKSLIQRIRHEIRFYAQFIGKYDLVINLTEGDRGCVISLLSRASQRMGYVKQANLMTKLARFDVSFNSQADFHTVQKDLQFIESIDSEKIDRKVSLAWNSNQEKKVNKLLKSVGISGDFVLVHPVSRWMFKCWAPEKMAECIDYLQNNLKKTVLLTTSSDQEEILMARQIAGLCQVKPFQLEGALTLQEYSYLSSKASLFFGVDTAPMHIAAANNTPVVALFGASKPEVWGPWDNAQGCSYVRTTGVQYNGIHSIVSNENLELFEVDGIKKSYGMEAIELEPVIQLLEQIVHTGV